MTTAHVNLTESEVQAVQALSQSQGKTPERILHDAIEQFLTQHQAENRLAALRQGRGIWRNRGDSPDAATLRSEWDRM